MGRTISLGVLERVRIASPCSMPWEAMTPVDGDRVRHCGACDLNVYNLSGMSRSEAEALVQSRVASGERLCAQLLVRADGTILTRDCPVGLRAARLKLARALTRLAAALTFLITGAALARSRDRVASIPGLSRVQPFATICKWVAPKSVLPAATPAAGSIYIRGDVCFTPAPPGGTPQGQSVGGNP